MSKKKLIAVAIILALVLCIGGMIAYFTDTDTATNVFTLGDDVDISITETWTAADGLLIHPGKVVNKAPSIKNDSSTTPAYVFAKITVPCYAAGGTASPTIDTPLFTFEANDEWALIKTSAVDTTAKTISYVYAYGSDSAMTQLNASATTTSAVFDSVTLDKDLTADQKATASTTPNIVIEAYGIQVDNLGVTAPADIYDLF